MVLAFRAEPVISERQIDKLATLIRLWLHDSRIEDQRVPELIQRPARTQRLLEAAMWFRPVRSTVFCEVGLHPSEARKKVAANAEFSCQREDADPIK